MGQRRELFCIRIEISMSTSFLFSFFFLSSDSWSVSLSKIFFLFLISIRRSLGIFGLPDLVNDLRSGMYSLHIEWIFSIIMCNWSSGESPNKIKCQLMALNSLAIASQLISLLKKLRLSRGDTFGGHSESLSSERTHSIVLHWIIEWSEIDNKEGTTQS